MDFLIKYGVDLFLALILIISVADCYHRGFVKSILSLVAVFVSLVAAAQLSTPTAEWGYDTFAANIITEKVEAAMPEGFDSSSASEVVNGTVDAMPEFLVSQLKELGIDIDKIAEDIKDEKMSDQASAAQIAEKIIRPGAVVLLRMICYILIFLIIRGILEFIIGLINKVFTLPVLRTANGWLGAAFGAVKGVIVVLLLCTVLNAISGITAQSNVGKAIENSKITAVAQGHNFGNFSMEQVTENTK